MPEQCHLTLNPPHRTPLGHLEYTKTVGLSFSFPKVPPHVLEIVAFKEKLEQ